MTEFQSEAHDALLKVQCSEGIASVCIVLKELLRGTTKNGCLKVLKAVEAITQEKTE